MQSFLAARFLSSARWSFGKLFLPASQSHYNPLVKTHQQIDRRSLGMVREIVARIDADPERRGLEHAKGVCRRWVARGNVPAREWMSILARPWEEVRSVLLDESEEGQRLRQSDPFCGILTPQERWAIYREAADDAK